MLVIVHAINDATGIPKDFTFDSYESFVNILNVEVHQYGSTRLRCFSKNVHRIVEDKETYTVEKIFADHNANSQVKPEQLNAYKENHI